MKVRMDAALREDSLNLKVTPIDRKPTTMPLSYIQFMPMTADAVIASRMPVEAIPIHPYPADLYEEDYEYVLNLTLIGMKDRDGYEILLINRKMGF